MSSKQFLAALAVLALGVCAAWPFRRERVPAVSAAISLPATELTLRQQDITLQVSPQSDDSPAVGLDREQSQPGELNELGIEPHRTARPPLESLSLPPEMPPVFRSLIMPAARVRAVNNAVADVGEDSRPRISAPREHRIVDGDTLEQLAERYLGSRARAGEIFAANRDLLDNPELLPLGKSLRIPSAADANALEPVAAPTY